MPTRTSTTVSRLFKEFVNALGERFTGKVRAVSSQRALVVFDRQGWMLLLSAYSFPTQDEPARPLIIRITVTTSPGNEILNLEHHLQALGARIEQREEAIDRLEFSMLPDEVLTLAPWFAAWFEKYATRDPFSPALPIQVSNPRIQRVLDGSHSQQMQDDTWWTEHYIWSQRAQDVYDTWATGHALRQDVLLIASANLPTPESALSYIPRTRPKFEMPAFPENWSTEKTLRYIPHYEQRLHAGYFLIGEVVEQQLALAARRGYIVLPRSAEDSKFWSAWANTWYSFCSLPQGPRPYIKLEVSQRAGQYGRKLRLSWDWISTGRAVNSLPSSDDLRARIVNYDRRVPKGVWRYLWKNDPLLVVGYTGWLTYCEAYHEPILWAFDWLAECYPVDNIDEPLEKGG